MDSPTILTPSTSQSSLYSDFTDEIDDASPQELSSYLMSILPDIDERPKQIRAWVSCWFKFHDIDPSAKDLVASIDKISWTSTYIRQVSARQLENELMSWGFEYGYATGIVKMIMQVRKVENKRKITDFLVSLKVKASRIEQNADEKVTQLSAAAVALIRKDVEIYIGLYLIFLAISVLYIAFGVGVDLMLGQEWKKDAVTMFAVYPTVLFGGLALTKLVHPLTDKELRAIRRCFSALGEDETGKNGVSSKQEGELKE